MLATLPVVHASEIVAGPAGRLGCDGDPSGQAIGSKWVLKRENTVPDASRVSIVARIATPSAACSESPVRDC
jgi:hypothetical protein